jgi:hypothetical protein
MCNVFMLGKQNRIFMSTDFVDFVRFLLFTSYSLFAGMVRLRQSGPPRLAWK